MAGEKYFLFQREPVTEYSSTESNTGDGLSVIAIPSDKIANITAKKGVVVFRFHGAGIYDSYGGSENEGLPNVKIEVACEAGNEVALIEQVLTFISRETSRSIMKFDAVSATSTFPQEPCSQAACRTCYASGIERPCKYGPHKHSYNNHCWRDVPVGQHATDHRLRRHRFYRRHWNQCWW